MFQNLDFEQATITPTPVGGLTHFPDPAQCFPGWTVGGSGTFVMYNGLSLNNPAVILMGPNFPNAANYTPLQGSYSVLLQYYGTGGPPPTLSQTGFIPADAKSMSFLTTPSESAGVVTLDDSPISLISIAGGRMAADISAFAGTEVELTFSTTTPFLSRASALYFDDVQFSPSQIPEPNMSALSGLAALLVGWRFLWRRRCRRN
jgi:hypothetical protein